MTKSSGKMRAIGNESGDKNIRNQVSEKRDGNQTMKEREKNLKEKAKKREEMSTTAPPPPRPGHKDQEGKEIIIMFRGSHVQ